MKESNPIIFASPTKSRIRNLQSIGRGLRRGDQKVQCKLFDIGDDLSWKSKKNYTLNHLIERVKIYNEEGFDYKLVKIDRKEVSYCQIINKYFGNGIYHHGIQKKYKIDEYGNNIGDIYEENWVHGKKHGICTYHGYRKEFWSNGIKYKTELYENDKLVEVN